MPFGKGQGACIHMQEVGTLDGLQAESAFVPTEDKIALEQSFAGLAEVVKAVQGTGVTINVSLSCTFGCPMESDVPVPVVLEWCRHFVEELGPTV